MFGIPLTIADKLNLASVFDMKSKFLYYHPINPEGFIDFTSAPLTSTLLRFNLDILKEYQDID